MTIKGKHPIRKCPFLEPFIGGHDNSRVLVYQDCMRDECQIWDGVNCSLNRKR